MKQQTITDTMKQDTNIIKKQIKNSLELYKYGKNIVFWDNGYKLASEYELLTYFQNVQAKLKLPNPSSPVSYTSTVTLF